MDQKIDVLIALAQGQNRSITSLSQEMGKVFDELDTIKIGKTDTIKYELEEATGKIARLEKQEENLGVKIAILEQKEFRKSIVLYNVDEQGIQSNNNLADITYKFLHETLELEPGNIFSKKNPGGEIRIDAIHRLGKPKTDPTKPRPVLVTFLTEVGK